MFLDDVTESLSKSFASTVGEFYSCATDFGSDTYLSVGDMNPKEWVEYVSEATSLYGCGHALDTMLRDRRLEGGVPEASREVRHALSELSISLGRRGFSFKARDHVPDFEHGWSELDRGSVAFDISSQDPDIWYKAVYKQGPLDEPGRFSDVRVNNSTAEFIANAGEDLDLISDLGVRSTLEKLDFYGWSDFATLFTNEVGGFSEKADTYGLPY